VSKAPYAFISVYRVEYNLLTIAASLSPVLSFVCEKRLPE